MDGKPAWNLRQCEEPFSPDEVLTVGVECASGGLKTYLTRVRGCTRIQERPCHLRLPRTSFWLVRILLRSSPMTMLCSLLAISAGGRCSRSCLALVPPGMKWMVLCPTFPAGV